jgi:uncharacterized protein YaaQ
VKLVLTIASTRDASRLTAALAERGLRSTRLASTGGFLREGNATLLIGCADDRVDEVMDLVHTICKPRTRSVLPLAYLGDDVHPVLVEPVEVTVGGATTFVVAVERFESS